MQEVFASLEFMLTKNSKKIESDILLIRLRTCGVDDHVPEIEQSIQAKKNKNRLVYHAMPYQCLSRVMVREIILQANVCLNDFGTKDNVANGLLPRNIIDNHPYID